MSIRPTIWFADQHAMINQNHTFEGFHTLWHKLKCTHGTAISLAKISLCQGAIFLHDQLVMRNNSLDVQCQRCPVFRVLYVYRSGDQPQKSEGMTTQKAVWDENDS